MLNRLPVLNPQWTGKSRMNSDRTTFSQVVLGLYVPLIDRFINAPITALVAYLIYFGSVKAFRRIANYLSISHINSIEKYLPFRFLI